MASAFCGFASGANLRIEIDAAIGGAGFGEPVSRTLLSAASASAPNPTAIRFSGNAKRAAGLATEELAILSRDRTRGFGGVTRCTLTPATVLRDRGSDLAPITGYRRGQVLFDQPLDRSAVRHAHAKTERVSPVSVGAGADAGIDPACFQEWQQDCLEYFLPQRRFDLSFS